MSRRTVEAILVSLALHGILFGVFAFSSRAPHSAPNLSYRPMDVDGPTEKTAAPQGPKKTAPPSSNQKSEPPLTAAEPPTSPNTGTPETTDAVRAKILGALEYPAALRRKHVHGTVRVSLWIAASGALTRTEVEHTSGNEALDHLALEACSKAAPFPAMTSGQKFDIPIVFQITAE